MKEIHYNDIAQAVACLAVEACYRLPADMVEAMRKAREAEPSPVGRNILDQLLENAGIAKEFDPAAQEERMDNELATQIFELDRCIECGCCVAACGTARMREDFIGATAINRMARFYIDPRDNRTPADYYDLIGDDQGVFGCMGLLACDSVCPKQLPLHDQLGIMRRMVSMESVRGILPEFLRKKMQGCGHSHCSGKD